MVKILLPQEIEVYYILPAIRREIAKALKSTSMSQKEISKRLGITEAAVSQYLTEKRAKDIEFHQSFLDEIKNLAPKITDPMKLVEYSNELVVKAKGELVTCRACKKFSQVPENCDACFKKDPYKEVLEILDEYDQGSPKKQAGFDHWGD